MLVATPFFIKNLGAEQYGLWMLINVVVQVMNALNFGVADSTIKQVSMYNATAQKSLLVNAVNKNVALSLLLFLLCAAIGTLASQAMVTFNWFHIPAGYKTSAKLTLMLFALSTGLKFIELVFVAVFKGLQRFDIAARLTMASRLSVLISSMVVVYFGHGLLGIVLVTLGCNVLNLVLQVSMVYYLANIKNLVPKFAQLNAMAIIQSNGWYWLQSVIALLGFLSDRILLGFLSDLKSVGYYSIAALIGSQIHNILLAFGGFMFPKVSAYHSLNKNLHPIYLQSRMVIAALGWGMVIGLLLFGDVIFKAWLGAETYQQTAQYINLYLGFIAVILLIIIPYYFNNGSSHVKLNSIFEAVLRSTHFLAMYLGFWHNGITGLLCGLIITTLFNMPFQYYIFNKKVMGTTKLTESVLPVLPALPILLLAFAQTWDIKLGLLVLFGLLFWLIYFKKAKLNGHGVLTHLWAK